MALKRAKNGQYVIKDKDEALRALKMMESLAEEIEEIRQANDIPEMEMDCVELKKAVTAWARDHGVQKIEMPEGHYYGLREDVNQRMWFATKDDIPDEANFPTGWKPQSALSILKKKYPKNYKELFKRITKRVIDPVKLDEAVGEGVIDLEDLRPAYHETYKSPYMRRYG